MLDCIFPGQVYKISRSPSNDVSSPQDTGDHAYGSYNAMKKSQERARDAFLDYASQTLASTSPSTSAYIMTQKIDEMINGQEIDAEFRSRYCVACGSPYMPGWTTSTSRPELARNPAILKQPQKEERRRQRRAVVHTCNLCHRNTFFPMRVPPVPEREGNRGMPVAAKPLSAPVAQEPESKSAMKPTARQRAKDRKSKNGLKALLSKSKQSATSSSPTFDLMDFMKT